MQLFYLKRKDGRAPYDEAEAFVIRAETPHKARIIAQRHGGDETGYGSQQGKIPFWTKATKTTCVPLTDTGKEGLIVRDFNNG